MKVDKQWWNHKTRHQMRRLVHVLRWLVFSIAVGVIVGLVGVAFQYSLNWANTTFTQKNWLLFLLPIGGLFIVWFYRLCDMEKDRGTNFILVAIRSNRKVTVKTAPLIFVSTVLTHLLGGSAGREGAALQLGGSIAGEIGRLLKLDEKDSRLITMCGMAAAFSALFGTPVASTVFAMEVISVGVMYYAALVPCMISSVISMILAKALGVHFAAFTLAGIPELGLLSGVQVLALGALCAFVSMLFCWVLRGVATLYRKSMPKAYLRVAVGGLLVIGLTLLTGTRDYNGAGTNVIGEAIGGTARPEAFAMKILFTALTLGAGYKGGEIVPAFFTGAAFGNVAGKLLGLSPSFGAGLGMVALFCGVTNCPMTSLIISVELFGGQGFIYFGIVCAVSYMLSGYTGLYAEQKIVYSKFRPVFIDKKVD